MSVISSKQVSGYLRNDLDLNDSKRRSDIVPTTPPMVSNLYKENVSTVMSVADTKKDLV